MLLTGKKLNGVVVKAELLQRVLGHQSSHPATARMAARWMLVAQAAARWEPKHLANVDQTQLLLRKVWPGHSGNS
jgi:hypothetical protein